MDVRKLTVIGAELQKGAHRLSGAENDEIFAKVLKRFRLTVTKNTRHPA